MITPATPMDSKLKKRLKGLGHDLHPVVTVAGNGLTKTVLAELSRALEDHELIKVKVAVVEREVKRALIAEMCELCGCQLVQQIGHLALVYKANPTAKPNLTNVHA